MKIDHYISQCAKYIKLKRDDGFNYHLNIIQLPFKYYTVHTISYPNEN